MGIAALGIDWSHHSADAGLYELCRDAVHEMRGKRLEMNFGWVLGRRARQVEHRYRDFIRDSPERRAPGRAGQRRDAVRAFDRPPKTAPISAPKA